MNSNLNHKVNEYLQTVNHQVINKEISKLEKLTFQTNFWQSNQAKKIMKQIALLKTTLTEYEQVKKLSKDFETYTTLILEEQKLTTKKELEQEKKQLEKKLTKLLNTLELKQYLNGKYDTFGAVLSIHSGQGGTEAMDWAQMLKRMYSRFFERNNWKATLVAESKGEEAGIKSVEFIINHPFAYGYLKHEQGTHRLVRLSPFNADNLRQTSFALVEVLPLIEESDEEIIINSNDLEWNFSRSGGAGGQNVNKVNTAVEVTHKPSNIVVKCREERTQVQNKQKALLKLKRKLAQIEANKLQEELAKQKGIHVNASWGNQIRNYVLHPYKLVKDTRTKIETSNPEAVLDGDLDEFIQAEIKL